MFLFLFFFSTEHLNQGWCQTHGFVLHFMFSLAYDTHAFDPQISLAYPDFIVINTGHYVHILNVSTYVPQIPPQFVVPKEEDIKISTPLPVHFADNSSEISESPSENLSTNSVVEAILEDFNEYDLEGKLKYIF